VKHDCIDQQVRVFLIQQHCPLSLSDARLLIQDSLKLIRSRRWILAEIDFAAVEEAVAA